MNCSTINLARAATSIRSAGFLNAATNQATATIATTAAAAAAAAVNNKKTTPPGAPVAAAQQPQAQQQQQQQPQQLQQSHQSPPPQQNGGDHFKNGPLTMSCANDNKSQQPQQQTMATTKNLDLALDVVQRSSIVCFDVDSTVIKEEGIDELAAFCGKGDEVARLTKEAMGGSMTFQDALRIRLNIIRPSQQQIHDFIAQRPSTLTANVQRFIEQLRAAGKQVFLISGGFACLIEPVANVLGIPVANLYANKLLFDCRGEYVTFDASQPTSKSGGKAEAISMIKRQHPDAIITMIGDGATDLEAVPPADYFIGFGGNVVRAEVFKRAKYYVNDFGQLLM